SRPSARSRRPKRKFVRPLRIVSISRLEIRRNGRRQRTTRLLGGAPLPKTQTRLVSAFNEKPGITSMRYIAFIKHTQDYRGIKPPPALMEAMGAFVGENLKTGKFVDGAGLQSTHRAKKVQLRNGQLRVVDGPFTESKEIVGGYTIME